ncbi:hypothetical protein [Bdellovibrio sp. HCB274]|uniref:hypothetical protein n=1 Tax=Bdellovibrio sp. HCB274 TaxID=3394361 RepID=UPI0039B3C4FB
MLTFGYFQTDKGDVMNTREVTKEVLESKLKTQIPQLNQMLAVFQVQPMKYWESNDCFTKKKRKKVVSK